MSDWLRRIYAAGCSCRCSNRNQFGTTAAGTCIGVICHEHWDCYMENLTHTHITCGDHRTFTISNNVKITAGQQLSAFVADHCTITAGPESFIQCRNHCTINASDSCTIDAGLFSTVKTGLDSRVTVGPGSIVTAGDGSEIRFLFWSGNKLEVVRAVVGQLGVRPDIPYIFHDGRLTATH